MGKRTLSYVSVKVVNDRTDLVFIRDIERALARAGMQRRNNQPFTAYVQLARLLGRTGFIKNLAQLGNAYVVPAGQVSEHRFFPVGYLHETIPYFFDSWERLFPRIERHLKALRCKVAFFSARQSAQYFNSRIPGLECFWLPEACDPRDYNPGVPLAERSIDVLELGRRLESLHQQIAQPLAESKRVHRFAKRPGQMIFPRFVDLVSGFAQTRLSVCFPGSVTHKDWAGNIETVTYRYFESMASKCIVYGSCPGELRDLFGYDPVINADLQNPYSQIDDILRQIDSYQELVDRNYQRLLEVGTWDSRTKAMLEILKARGYS